VTSDDVQAVSLEISPHLALERQDNLTSVRAAMQELQNVSDDLYKAVWKRDIEERSYQEIALELDLPEGTVKSRINRGRKELARILRRRGVFGRGAARPGAAAVADSAGAES